jgi:hypothetical protein
MSAPSAPMLKAAKLWEKTSAKGNTYFVGRLGGVRILILENRGRGNEGEADWHLFFIDGEKRESAEASGTPQRSFARRPYPAKRQARPPVRPDSVALPDDPVDDIGP